jgi:hypothetical protein
MACTIFKDIFSTEPFYTSVDNALERIRSGASKARIEEIRNAIDKEKSNDLKKLLPSVCFSGKFPIRKDAHNAEHSGFLVLDFDNVEDLGIKAAQLYEKPFVYAYWVSPSGNGIKALIRIADGKKHREHFAALKEVFPDADNSGVNESRVCYESYDPNIHINKNAEVFKRTTTHEKIETKQSLSNEVEIFEKILKWLSNRGDSFSKGERNIFIYKLAGACCRYGIYENSASGMIQLRFPPSNDFTEKETNITIKSAYRGNGIQFGTAAFEKNILVDKVSRKEVAVEYKIDPNEPTRDVIYGASVKANAIEIWRNGYAKVKGIGVPKIDEHFKSKKGELTATTGIGNYGKSAFKKWYKLMRVLLYGEKYACFVPEDNPAEEYYHDFVEMLLGQNCAAFNADGTPNLNKPKIEIYSNAYDFISKHIFYVSPDDDNTPTLDYILRCFLELIIKEGVDGCEIDPWNQIVHDYSGMGANVSKYLEYALGRLSRFAQKNSVYLDLIIHPKQMPKEGNGNYACPDIFDLNDGAMWNNKLDNLLVYHRPFAQTDATNSTCEFHSLKIKRQKIVGKKGFVVMDYIRRTRRFEVDGTDHLSDILRKLDMSFNAPVVDYKPPDMSTTINLNTQAGISRPGYQTIEQANNRFQD